MYEVGTRNIVPSLRRHINSDIEIMDIMPLSFKSAQNTLTWHSAAISHINSSHKPHLTSNISVHDYLIYQNRKTFPERF